MASSRYASLSSVRDLNPSLEWNLETDNCASHFDYASNFVIHNSSSTWLFLIGDLDPVGYSPDVTFPMVLYLMSSATGDSEY